MKGLYNICIESILDDDEITIKNTQQHTLTAEIIRNLLKDISDDLSERYEAYTINDDMSITIGAKDVTFKKNIPDLIKIKEFNKRVKSITFLGKDVTSIKGLPMDIRDIDLNIIACNITNFVGAPKICKYLKIDTCYDIKSLKDIPYAKNIRFKDVKKGYGITSKKWTVKEIAKYSKTKQSNIVIL